MMSEFRELIKKLKMATKLLYTINIGCLLINLYYTSHRRVSFYICLQMRILFRNQQQKVSCLKFGAASLWKYKYDLTKDHS